MKHTTTMKYTALMLMLVLCLSMTSCYIPPDEITDSTGGLNGTENLPWQTIAPTATVTPTPIPTAYAPMQTQAPAIQTQIPMMQTQPPAAPNNGGYQVYPTATATWASVPTINWNDSWGTGNGSGTIVTITPTPYNGNNNGYPTYGAAPTPSPTPYNGPAAIATNPPATQKPTATPAPTSSTLEKGASGAEVKKVQQRLKDLGYYRGSVDGDYGSGTESAVKQFQRANKLSADGKVGSKTRSVLFSGNAIPYASSSLARTATPRKTATPTPKRTATPRPTATPTPRPTATPNLTNARYLKEGSSGSDVRRLQQRLIDLGWLAGKADGEYGGATQAAVKAFQKKMGLWNDGIAGPDTQAVLYSSSAAKASSPAASSGESLREGMNGDQVRALQKRLKALGYYTGTVDGDYGTGTAAAVRAFQNANGLTSDGIAGTATLNRMYGEEAIPASGRNNGTSSSAGSSSSGSGGAAPTATPRNGTPVRATATPRVTSTPRGTATPRPTATPNLSKARYLTIGYSGSDVRRLQQRLIDLGWLAGSPDGEYDGATQAAVKAFQKKTGIWNDGIAGPGTQELLYSAGAARSSSPAASLGKSLRQGMNGDDVRALQKRLKTLGYYSGTVDGSYGEGTTAAVMAFQSAHGLEADGIAGTATLNAIYLSDNTVTSGSSAEEVLARQTASPATATPRPQNTAAPVISSTGYNVLRQGVQSSEVTRLQQRLKELNYYKGAVDGHYGSGTINAVKDFQTMNGLTSDGVAGPATQRAIFGTSTSQSYSTLRLTDQGSNVSNLQYTLYELGYYDGEINGFYGDTTSDAVRAFQIANDLTPVDGVAGNKTLRKLYSADPVSAAEARDKYTTMRRGDKGENVVELQDALKGLGYLTNITGRYDRATEDAVTAFQRQNSITADGIAGAITQKLLYEGHPLRAPR